MNGEDGTAPGPQFERLLEVMDRLRSPGGCPWDAAQTHESLLRYLVEEAYEVVEAVETLEPSRRRRDELVEELGDVLLQVVFHARIGQEHTGEERFDVSDVIDAVTAKLIRRHPHVFPGDDDAAREPAGAATAMSSVAEATSPTNGAAASSSPAGTDDASSDAAPAAGESPDGATSDTADSLESAPDTAELAARWDAVKRNEKPHRTRIFDGIPPALPALAYGEKAFSKARRHGVPAVVPVQAEPTAEQREAEERELGDQLLALVETSSARGLDAERALRTAVRRFVGENDGPVAR
ncbi:MULTISPECIES: MazG nucleotide pyrophosphohydrolase domain-containing protein [Kocuria]|uniref:Nucleoside triphosphate pyrophosphohydrolase/pyrophosphatase MazG n=1 Tax=Kocuria varians TaxID=1272 RepID=A0A7D7L2W4_KOCVA|nr:MULTISPECIES: MazG nucleotide pyrophosphohydrolase domain-containing protein [Kocuria]QMS56604.1 Nucleoside triphosphate pyrophosphohydrolase/pyrophosphatase MazG [Kocuria varians]